MPEINPSTNPETIIKMMKRSKWTFLLSSAPGQRGYLASFTKTIQVVKATKCNFRVLSDKTIVGEAEGLTLALAVAMAATNAIVFEKSEKQHESQTAL